MTAIICPQCKQEGFVWAVYDDDAYTVWLCLHCKYTAEENEALEGPCAQCGDQHSLALKDGEEYYRYCDKCGNNTPLEKWRETKKYNESL